MKLVPRRPAGRSNRKALEFAAEIARLRSEGHSCEAIRLALLDAGMQVSSSTVKREVARIARRNAAPGVPAHSVVSSPSDATLFDSQRSPNPHSPSGKDIAALWMKDQITNPLVRARIAHESGRH